MYPAIQQSNFCVFGTVQLCFQYKYLIEHVIFSSFKACLLSSEFFSLTLLSKRVRGKTQNQLCVPVFPFVLILKYCPLLSHFVKSFWMSVISRPFAHSFGVSSASIFGHIAYSAIVLLYQFLSSSSLVILYIPGALLHFRFYCSFSLLCTLSLFLFFLFSSPGSISLFIS